MGCTEENKGLLEELDQRIREWKAKSQDPYFTEYLTKLQARLMQERYQLDLLKEELEQNSRLYHRRMQGAASQTVRPVCPVNPQERMQMPWGGQAANRQFGGMMPAQEAGQPGRTVQIRGEAFRQPDERSQPQETGKFRNNLQPAVHQTGKSAEFAVGAAVLSIIGGVFILAAFVMLGINFMGQSFIGVCLYGISALFLLVSELALYRRWPMFGTVLSSIGIGGLYLSTVINDVGLHNFNLWVTLGLILGITLFTMWLGRKRDLVWYRIMGMAAGYLCFFTVRPGITQTDFLLITGLSLLMNLVVALFPAKRAGKLLHITQMALNTAFTFCYMLYALIVCWIDPFPVLIFVFGSVMVQQLLYVSGLKICKREDGGQGGEKTMAGLAVVYAVSSLFWIFMLSFLVYGCAFLGGSFEAKYCLIGSLVTGGISTLAILAIRALKCSGWQYVYSFLNFALLCISVSSEKSRGFDICAVSLLILSKLLSRRKDRIVRINELLLTVIVCIQTLFAGAPWIYLLFGGILFSIFMLGHWKTFYEILLTSTLALYAAVNLPPLLKLPMAVGILLIGMLLFNHVRRWRDSRILIYNIICMTAQAACFFVLGWPVYRNAAITYLCMLVFGTATIVLLFQEKYHMDFKGKYMLLAGFLTYMALIFKTEFPIVNSILMMVIALLCVGIGFAAARKSVRIYGLVLSLLICGKMVLFDFFRAPAIQKTVLFLIVGIIALTIAAIYIILEKRNSRLEQESQKTDSF